MARVVPVALAFALLAAATAAPAQEIVAVPVLPAYGEAVAIDLKNTSWPTYLPATRYSRSGFSIDIEYEYIVDGFGPSRPDFGLASLSLGELPPGNYQVRARLRDIERPSSAPLELATQLAVMPPREWGIYTLPQSPQAFSATQAIVRSAAYFDPATLRVSVSGNVVRVDFDYQSFAPGVTPVSPTLTTFASVRIPTLAPGSYRLDGWGRGGVTLEQERFFTRNFVVAPTVEVIEFHSGSLNHYFVTADAAEIELVERGGQGDWKRTGQRFSAWLRQADAPPGAVPVCRFYARGPNSHFYTATSQECSYLKTLEQQGRAAAAASGETFLGWGYEMTAFWALEPKAGTCAGGSPVYRVYNGRAAEMDSNHRFVADAEQYGAMALGWIDEGVRICAAP
jgi:hypothetical protein